MSTKGKMSPLRRQCLSNAFICRVHARLAWRRGERVEALNLINLARAWLRDARAFAALNND